MIRGSILGRDSPEGPGVQGEVIAAHNRLKEQLSEFQAQESAGTGEVGRLKAAIAQMRATKHSEKKGSRDGLHALLAGP
jgi:hypothetical protein